MTNSLKEFSLLPRWWQTSIYITQETKRMQPGPSAITFGQEATTVCILSLRGIDLSCWWKKDKMVDAGKICLSIFGDAVKKLAKGRTSF
jgi:hypothetical protein